MDGHRGTSIRETHEKGIISPKLAMGKPAGQVDAANTGYVLAGADTVQTARQPREVWARGKERMLGWGGGWGGIMGWKFQSDPKGVWISTLKMMDAFERLANYGITCMIVAINLRALLNNMHMYNTCLASQQTQI